MTEAATLFIYESRKRAIKQPFLSAKPNGGLMPGATVRYWRCSTDEKDRDKKVDLP